MLDTEATLSALLDRRKTAVALSQQQLGLRASGRSAASLTPTVTRQGSEVTGTLSGVAYWKSQNSGRGPNRSRRPSRAMVASIAEWTRIRGIKIPPYAIALKIAREGIKVPNPYNAGGVLDTPLSTDTIKSELKTVLRPVYGQQLRNALFSR